MTSLNTTPKSKRVQALLHPDLHAKLEAHRKAEDRSESKMTAILIEEAITARSAAQTQDK